ncbi:hypothetical protein ACLB1G_21200 [Oxalobacteraceae bacterium A2-2]
MAKIYTKADAKAAIDRADYNLFKQWRSVRSDLSARQFAALGNDVGHSYRHVDGTAERGKSTYENADVAAEVTMQLLNSKQGQKILKRLDKASPEGSFMEDNPDNRRIEAVVTGDWYGKDENGTKAKITKAACQVMKLGADVLWVHTTFPTAF